MLWPVVVVEVVVELGVGEAAGAGAAVGVVARRRSGQVPVVLVRLVDVERAVVLERRVHLRLVHRVDAAGEALRPRRPPSTGCNMKRNMSTRKHTISIEYTVRIEHTS